MTDADANKETTMEKFIRFSNVEMGDARWLNHFDGRPGCRRVLVERDTEQAEAQAPGVYIYMPEAVAQAWDRAIRDRRTANPAGVEAALDAVAPRA